MTDTDALVFECALDAPPEKVWRALTIPEYLERWLKPDEDDRPRRGHGRGEQEPDLSLARVRAGRHRRRRG